MRTKRDRRPTAVSVSRQASRLAGTPTNTALVAGSGSQLKLTDAWDEAVDRETMEVAKSDRLTPS